MAGDLAECNEDLQAAGRVCPRTCELCGLGPCVRRVEALPVAPTEQAESAAPVPLPEAPVAPMTEYMTYRLAEWSVNGSTPPLKVRVYESDSDICIIREETRPGATLKSVPAKDITFPGRVYLWTYWVKCTSARVYTVLVAASNSIKADKEARAKIRAEGQNVQAITLQHRTEGANINLNPGVDSTVLFFREEDH